jgi:hypothetical protein
MSEGTYLSRISVDGIGTITEFLTIEEYHAKYGWGELSRLSASVIDSACVTISRQAAEPILSSPPDQRYSVKIIERAYNNYKEGMK